MTWTPADLTAAVQPYLGQPPEQVFSILQAQTETAVATFLWGDAVTIAQTSANFSWPKIVARSRMTPTLPPATAEDAAILAAINATQTPLEREIDPASPGWQTIVAGISALQAVGDLSTDDAKAIEAKTTATVPTWPGLTLRDVWIALGQPE